MPTITLDNDSIIKAAKGTYDSASGNIVLTITEFSNKGNLFVVVHFNVTRASDAVFTNGDADYLAARAAAYLAQGYVLPS